MLTEASSTLGRMPKKPVTTSIVTRISPSAARAPRKTRWMRPKAVVEGSGSPAPRAPAERLDVGASPGSRDASSSSEQRRIEGDAPQHHADHQHEHQVLHGAGGRCSSTSSTKREPT
ncbi:hypothetical protein ABXN37_08845 [Piscinibacter sakaiensis]|uniref:hypothetical protein n=1 Tax=Piscinibacter sakaiensis TaxID=1547922 RepID=UPI00372998A9